MSFATPVRKHIGNITAVTNKKGGTPTIDKTGSLCCVAARPHESSNRRVGGSGEWSLDPNDSHWRTSFSPPLSRRWDFSFHPDGGGMPRGHGSSYSSSSNSSSNSKGSRRSRSRMTSAFHQYSVSDGIVSYFSSPSDSFHAQYWSPMPHGDSVSITAMPESRSGSSFQSYKEGCLGTGTSACVNNADSGSSHSDIGDYDQSAVIHVPPAHKNFSGRYSFMSKPVYPMPLPPQVMETDSRENMVSNSSRFLSSESRNSFRWPDNPAHHELKSFGGFSEFGSMQAFPELNTSSQRERSGWVSANSSDSGWDRESPVQPEMIDAEYSKYGSPFSGSSLSISEGLKCGLCERRLSQKSPWSSHRMIKCGDFPASGVLSCGHVYHADCLEQTIPESQKHDPPCPSCDGVLNNALVFNSEQSVSVSGLRTRPASGGKIPSFRAVTDDSSPSPSGYRNHVYSDNMTDISGKKWDLQMPACSKKSFLSKTLSRKHFFKGKSIKELPAAELGRKNVGSSVHLYRDIRSTDNFPAGCSRG